MNDLILDDDPATDVQAAYDNSSGGNFNAVPRAPWTIARHSAAMNLGCKIVLAIGPDVKELMLRGTYSNALRDVIIVLWLCSLPTDEVIRLNCILTRDDEQKAVAKAFEWAEKIGLSYGSKLFLEGLAILDGIITQVWRSFYGIGNLPENNGELKKNSGQPGKSESLITPQPEAAKPLPT